MEFPRYTMSFVERIQATFAEGLKKLLNLEPEVVLMPVPLTELRLDAAYQKFVGLTLVNEIQAEFDAAAAQFLHVMLADDGISWCIDGRHRCQAMINLGIPEWPAIVISQIPLPAQAKLFTHLNRRKNQTTNEFLKSLYYAEDPDVLAMLKIMHRYNLTYPWLRDKRRRAIGNLGAFKIAFGRDNGVALEKVLSMIEAAGWFEEIEAYYTPIIGGLTTLFALAKASKADLSQDVLVEVLRKHPPGYLLNTAKVDGVLQRFSVRSAIALLIQRSYNKKMTNKARKIKIDKLLQPTRSDAAKRSIFLGTQLKAQGPTNMPAIPEHVRKDLDARLRHPRAILRKYPPSVQTCTWLKEQYQNGVGTNNLAMLTGLSYELVRRIITAEGDYFGRSRK